MMTGKQSSRSDMGVFGVFGHGAFIAVDWGTTNRRAWRMNVQGEVEDVLDESAGIMAVPAGGFAAEVAGLRARLGDLPMLLAGMIGSNRGWSEVPYVPCPADQQSIKAAIAWIDERTGIVPGVCQNSASHPDVMRGEEVQILGGLACGILPQTSLVCLPGTHAKWACVRAGRIESFHTWMTGEVFALLSRHSILAPQLTGTAQAGRDFAAGVAASADGDPLAGLFRLRAAAVLNAGVHDGPSYVSGLLIGSEVRAGLTLMNGNNPIVIGQPDLCALYIAALTQIEIEAISFDGAAAFRAGITSLIRELA